MWFDDLGDAARCSMARQWCALMAVAIFFGGAGAAQAGDMTAKAPKAPQSIWERDTWWVVKPDLQYIVHPNGGQSPEDGTRSFDHDFLAGLRSTITF
jgi:carbohydrate-selective porin OprB